jgi:SagB-type dehydrogenase family enzyme
MLSKGNYYDVLNPIITAEPIVNLKDACCIVFITSMFERTIIKYGDRGYRFILMKTGFVSENISLICESIGLSSCMVGGYQDDKINEFLGIVIPYESIQNIIIIGKPK